MYLSRFKFYNLFVAIFVFTSGTLALAGGSWHLKCFTYLSESCFLTALEIIESSIKEINCPKTDLVEKYLFLPIVNLNFATLNYDIYKEAINLASFLSDNNEKY